MISIRPKIPQQHCHANGYKPNVVVEWLTLLLRIREISTTLTGYSDLGFSWFSSVPGEFRAGTLNEPRPLPTKSFPIRRHSLVPFSSTLSSLVTEKAS
jgi:hypothetical protein